MTLLSFNTLAYNGQKLIVLNEIYKEMDDAEEIKQVSSFLIFSGTGHEMSRPLIPGNS